VQPASAASSVSRGPGAVPRPSGASASIVMAWSSTVRASTRMRSGSTVATMVMGMVGSA
jgi:hypothetical protein